MQKEADTFQCASCHEEGYDGPGSIVETPNDVCPFHEAHGEYAKREHFPSWHEDFEEAEAQITPIDPKLRRVKPEMEPEEISKIVFSTEDRLDQGILIHRIRQVTGRPFEEISECCGKSGSWAANRSRFGRLTPAVQKMVRDGKLTSGAAYHLGVVPKEHQEALAKEIVKNKFTISDAKRFVTRALSDIESFETDEGEVSVSGEERREEPSVSVAEDGNLELILHSLGEADRLMNQVGQLSFRELMDAFQTPQDLRAARSLLLTAAHRLNELEHFIEHIRRARFPEVPGIRNLGD